MISNGPEPENTPDDGSEPVARTTHWISGLFSAEALAVGAFALALISSTGGGLFGIFALGPAALGGTSDEHQWWFMLPTLIPGALGLLLGLAGVRRAVLDGAPRWTRALTGGAAFIAFGVLALTLISWASQPDLSSLFEEF